MGKLTRIIEELEKLCLASLVFLVSGTVAGIFAEAHPYLDWFANFRPLIAIAATVPLIVLAARRRPAAFAVLAVLVVNAAIVFPWTDPTQKPSSCDAEVTAVSINALHERSNHDALVAQLVAAKPDVVFISELAPELRDKVTPLYRHRIWSEKFPKIALFSQFPIGTVAYGLSPYHRPHIDATLHTPAGVLRVVGSHTTAPFGVPQSIDRNAALDSFAAIAAATDQPLILLGDLNVTMFSPHYQPLEDAGLINARAARGVHPTWPSISPVRIPLDHVLHTRELQTCDLRVGPAFGSDHLPLYVGLARRSTTSALPIAQTASLD